MFQKAKFFKQVALFSKLDDDELLKTMHYFKEENYSTNDYVYKEGQLTDKVYVVQQGDIHLERNVLLKNRNENVKQLKGADSSHGVFLEMINNK